jgi:hypothetical protein
MLNRILPSCHALRVAAGAIVLALPLALGAPAAAQADDSNNGVCGPNVESWNFSVSKLGPHITGTWNGQAPGIGVTRGVQHFSTTISLENGRLYLSGNGVKTELRPVRGTRKALRYDFINQRPLPKSAYAMDISLEDLSLVMDCDLSIAPQFTWTFGSGDRRSSGIYTFAGPNIAVGTMWNSGGGAREVLLQR